MGFTIASRRRKPITLAAQHPDARIIDVTSKADLPWQKFSPFYPHGEIPIPGSPDITAESVEGIWQGLKVFEGEDVDTSKFEITNMKGIKRSMRTRGRVLGHRFGNELLDYQAARFQIYLPAYLWVLEHKLQAELEELCDIAAKQPVVLLDYETNDDVRNLTKPLSHASLVVKFVVGEWPDSD